MKNQLLFLLAIILSATTSAQISQGGEPLNWDSKSVLSDVPFVKTPVLDMNAILAEDAVVDQYKESPFRFGIDHAVNYNFFSVANEQSLNNEISVLRMGIDCPDATSVNFIFNEFYLAEGAELYIYTEDRSEFLGAFTSSNNKSYGSLAIGVIHSDRIIIELLEPTTIKGQSLLSISEITHGYRPVVNKFAADKGPFGNSGSCNMNVNCPDGDDWQDEKRGVGLILQNGSAICTGSLVNNTNQDETPYFLTAAHCDGNENNWVIYFNHEYAGCSNSGSAPTNQSISGGTQVASTSASDAHLVLLSSNVPASYEPYYNGWNATGSAVTNAIGIHHPSGDVKKISFDDDACQKTNYLSSNTTSSGTHWRIEAWERNTTTEGGSSGSPLFDQNSRIIGQLHGGFASCTTTGANDQDWYGAMAVSWPTLDGFLAPGSSVTVLDGFDPAASTGPLTLDLKTYLEGPYDSGAGTMNDLLRQSGNIPTTEPYTSLGFTHVNGGGGETTTTGALALSGSNAIVDWIFIELRSESNPTTVLATQSALLQRDGDIVDANGSSDVTFGNVTESNVYVVLRHRNHFGVRTANLQSTSSSTVTVDFTNPSTPLLGGAAAMTTVSGSRVMISGDANSDGQINAIDKNNAWRVHNGQAYTYFGSTSDFDVNGVVNSVDKNILWRVNNSKQEQLD